MEPYKGEALDKDYTEWLAGKQLELQEIIEREIVRMKNNNR